MIATYVKKPVVVEAIQFKIDNFSKVRDFLGEHLKVDNDGDYYIETQEGFMYLTIDDYIVKGVKGDFYPCKPDVFEFSHEKLQ